MGKLFIVLCERDPDKLAYYATENGFQHFNPFHDKPFNQLLIPFNSKDEANQFIRRYCRKENPVYCKSVAPHEQENMQSFQRNHETQIKGFVQAEKARVSLLGRKESSSDSAQSPGR